MSMETWPHIQNGNTHQLGDSILLISLEVCVLYGSTNYHPFKDTMINDPFPTPIGLSNYHWMRNFFLSLKLRYHYSTSMKSLLLTTMQTSFHLFSKGIPRHYAQQEINSSYMLCEARYHHQINNEQVKLWPHKIWIQSDPHNKIMLHNTIRNKRHYGYVPNSLATPA